MDLLGSPQRSYPSIHIAGTNGKTSVARMVDALLTALHRRTGRTTSPHLQSAVERIAIDGEPITPCALRRDLPRDRAVRRSWSTSSRKRPAVRAMSKFEVVTAMAFAAFADAPVDVAVVEVGLGGRWDATNVVNAPVAVITPIGIDHTDYLGHDIAEIAEREGRHHHPAARDRWTRRTPSRSSAAKTPEAMEVLLAQAVRADAAVAREDSEFAVLDRQIAVGGQVLDAAGPRRGVPGHLPAAARRASGPQRGGRAGRGRGVLRRGRAAPARHRRGAGRFRRGHQPRPAGAGAQSPRRCSSTPRTTGRRRGAGGGAGRGVRLPLSRRRGGGDGRQGRRRHPRGAGAGVRPDRRHPQRLAARRSTSTS